MASRRWPGRSGCSTTRLPAARSRSRSTPTSRRCSHALTGRLYGPGRAEGRRRRHRRRLSRPPSHGRLSPGDGDRGRPGAAGAVRAEVGRRAAAGDHRAARAADRALVAHLRGAPVHGQRRGDPEPAAEAAGGGAVGDHGRLLLGGKRESLRRWIAGGGRVGGRCPEYAQLIWDAKWAGLPPWELAGLAHTRGALVWRRWIADVRWAETLGTQERDLREARRRRMSGGR